MVRSLREQRTLPRVRYKSGVQAKLRKLKLHVVGDETHEMRHHAFLSHVWVTGQDQVRVIKSLLKEVLPGIRVFLDVRTKNISRISTHAPYLARPPCVTCLASDDC